MQNLASVLIAAAALVVLYVVARSARTRYARKPGGEAAARAPADDELVAVIAAAVSAASGTAPGSFRIAGFGPSAATGGAGGWSRGFNTPVWGHIERFANQERP